MEEFPMRIRN